MRNHGPLLGWGYWGPGTAEVHRAILDADWRAAEVGKGGVSWELEAIVKPCCSPYEGWTVFFDSAKASCAGIVCCVGTAASGP